MMTETKESNIPETLSAGTFVDRPFLDRINPFTPFSAKKFVPNENAKKLLDKYKKQYGKNLVVLPLDEKLKKEGSFLPGTLTADYRGGRFYDKDFVGGAGDPFKRYVYINPEKNRLFDLSHEASHAFDPKMLVNPAYGKERPTGLLRVAGGFIDALTDNRTDFDRQNFASAKKLNLDRYEKELNAQLGVLKDYDFLGVESKHSSNMEKLFNYPKMYDTSDEAKQLEKEAINKYLVDAPEGSIKQRVENYLKNLNN